MAYELIKNKEYNSTEVKFDGVPAKEIREKLKENGFRWHKTKGVWYSRLSIEETNAILSAENVVKIENSNEQDNLPTAQTKPVKIYYNGFRREDGELIKCNYSMMGNGDICVTADNLPRDIFPDVKNDTEPYDDYYKRDYVYIRKDHPLYRFFLFAYNRKKLHDAKQSIKYFQSPRGKRYYGSEAIEMQEKVIREYEKQEDPGQPTNADLLLVDKMREDYEKSVIEAKEAEERAYRERIESIKNNASEVIEKYVKLYPLQENAKDYAVVEWSELASFRENNRSEKYGGGKYSIKALDKIFAEVDAFCHKDDIGYYKTDFRIVRDNESIYNGRYDLGDGEQGLFDHIYKYQKYYMEREKDQKTAEEIKEIEELINWLAELVA